MRRTVSIALATIVGAALLLLAQLSAPAADGDRTAGATAYRNAVSRAFADTFADPAIIRGKDGFWYAFGTTDPLREGEGERHLLPIARSTNLVDWTYVGDAFTPETMPAWADRSRDAALWAPDIRYVDGEYRLYYVVTETTVTGEPNDNAIGVATAPTPTGPWTDSGAPVVGPRRGASGNAGDFLWTFDPSHVSDTDGTEHLFYGSYYGGMFVTELDETGTRAVGEPTMVAIDNKYEGAYVVRRRGWWYLFASSANCCAGPTTGYSVHVGRSRDLEGPYVDRLGQRMDVSRAGGTPVVAPNGNGWVGTGHNAVVTDLAGQDWMAYHAIDRRDPYLDEPFGINERPMLLDRMDWVDGWPTVRAGAWASQGRQPGPVTGGRHVTDFSDGIERNWRTEGRWSLRRERDAGRYVAASSSGGGVLLTRGAVPTDVRVEADLRWRRGGTGGLTTALRRPGEAVTALVDTDRGRLVVQVAHRGRPSVRRSAALPASFDPRAWHSVVLEVADGRAVARVGDARLGDPHAVVRLRLPRRTGEAAYAGALAKRSGVQVDNLSVVRAAEPVTTRVDPPRTGRLDRERSDEFDGARLERAWRWVREPDGRVADGVFRWRTQAADLVGRGNNASVLLRRPPKGDWTVETKVSIDLGTDTVRNFQQAGLVAYAHDDLFTRLSHVAIWNTRQTEFGKEMPFAEGLAFGGTIVGPPSGTTWLRLSHRLDRRNGEHELRASTSRDGRTWVHGGVWTLPKKADLRVGLVSHGAAKGADPATARFHYVRFYRGGS